MHDNINVITSFILFPVAQLQRDRSVDHLGRGSFPADLGGARTDGPTGRLVGIRCLGAPID